MSKDLSLKLPTGHKLDALIATKVMGWTWHDGHGTAGPSYWQDANGEPVIVDEWGEWEPSTSLAHAWKVIERMRDNYYVLKLYQAVPGDEWHAAFYVHAAVRNIAEPKGYGAYAKTAPLAICYAALKTLMYEKEKPAQLMGNVNITKLRTLCQRFVDDLDEKGYVDEDLRHYIFEAAMTAIFGESVWPWIREKE